ncbi:MAG: reverse transcriptase family protein [Desulfobacula sp.]|uniref:reverse transcriptase family protein n=1 Tax=Desulfobacula sp. TaxID=2593537 RepID=UPI0025C687BD|nr:reverse transcriptase family protein [Desulfobacula sp.]MCD4719839.1 reverse transcriptase family protein [Desulfobacula sp.]
MDKKKSCGNKKQYLKNLRLINQRANVDPEIIDLIEAYARLRLDYDKEICFYSNKTSSDKLELNKMLAKNRHLDPRCLFFLKAYFIAMKNKGLTCLINSAHLAHLLNVSIDHLIWLSNDKSNQYTRFHIKKSSGAKREILAPKPKLKIVQRQILDNILQKIQLNSHAEGFRKKRSILTNAKRHIGKKVVIKMDVKNFFPSITFKRVLGLFIALGYPHQVSMTLTKLMTHDGKLPTGAPTSPAISNILSTKLDKRFANLGEKTDFDYSRYADDISISSNNRNITRMIPFFKKIVQEEGFEINEAKMRILRNGGRQKIAGIVVNQKLNIEKREIKKIRAVLFNCRNKDINQEIKKWAQKEKGLKASLFYTIDEFKSSMLGKINFIKMVNPQTGQNLLDQLNDLNA